MKHKYKVCIEFEDEVEAYSEDDAISIVDSKIKDDRIHPDWSVEEIKD